MKDISSLSNEAPEFRGTGINQSGETHANHLEPFMIDAQTEDPLKRIIRLQEILKELFPITRKEWVDSFLRVIHPGHKLHIVETVTVVYQELVSNTDLCLAEKKFLYGLISRMSCGFMTIEDEELIPDGLPSAGRIYDMYLSAFYDGSRPEEY